MRAFTPHARGFDILVSQGLSYPRYLFTDGQFKGVDRNRRPLSGSWVFEDASYVAWVTERHPDRDPSNYYIQTTLRASELRKALGKIKPKSIQLRCRHWT